MKSILFGEKSYRVEDLPSPYKEMRKSTTYSENFSSFNQGKRIATLNAGVVKAVLNYFAGDKADIVLVKIGKNSYATEARVPEGVMVSSMNANGSLRSAIVSEKGEYFPLQNIYKDGNFDTTSFILGFLPIVKGKFDEVRETLKILEESHDKVNLLDEGSLYKLSDALYRIFTEKMIEIDDKAGNIEFLTEETVKLGGLRYNEVICGIPEILSEERVQVFSKNELTVAEAKKEFREFSSGLKWTDEEKELIPGFDDEFKVPEEALKMARRFVLSRGEKRPMVNFMWRGITAYGKSTGVEVMASILNMPLLRMTCHSNMETQDFLSDFVPNTSSVHKVRMPSFEEISSNPKAAYFNITGQQKEHVTPDMCLEAYAKVMHSNESSSAPRFKHVESNFVKALEKGYIVEVQEISRIKDSGVLVGLNEYDREGAIIPLVDGSHSRRNKNAIVVYTDNVGYNSCRPLDPSVIRRMSFIIDSYDMPREKALERLQFNTQVNNPSILQTCYMVWEKIKDFCQSKGITDGSVSLSELEMWVTAVKIDGYTNFRQNCIECVVAKATNDTEEQETIISSVVDLNF